MLRRGSRPPMVMPRTLPQVPGGNVVPMTAVLDHLAIGTPNLADGWELFGGVLGGTWAYGMDSPGYWWGQLRFAAGPKIELLTPTGGPDAAFLEIGRAHV